MEHREVGGIICSAYTDEDLQDDKKTISEIAENTDNTWQPERPPEETIENTLQGKVAEKMFEEYINTEFSEHLEVMAYDLIRCDHNEKHAPFDFLIWEKDKSDIFAVVQSIQSDIRTSYGRFVKISEATRTLCKREKVKIVEVKSTKIANRHKQRGFSNDYSDDVSVTGLSDYIVKNDDFLCYPLLKRKEAREDYTVVDYCIEYQQKNPQFADLHGKILLERVLKDECRKQLCDIFVRVYVDEIYKRGLALGWITKEQMYSGDVKLKRMKQEGKSEQALYWAKRLTNLRKMEDVEDAVISSLEVFASPYTKTSYYHKSKNCSFLDGIRDEEIVKFKCEEDAIAKGRYTCRCKKCFND